MAGAEMLPAAVRSALLAGTEYGGAQPGAC